MFNWLQLTQICNIKEMLGLFRNHSSQKMFRSEVDLQDCQTISHDMKGMEAGHHPCLWSRKGDAVGSFHKGSCWIAFKTLLERYSSLLFLPFHLWHCRTGRLLLEWWQNCQWEKKLNRGLRTALHSYTVAQHHLYHWWYCMQLGVPNL